MKKLIKSWLLPIILWVVCAVSACHAELISVGDTITLKLGPFVDASDGVTPEEALTINQADVKISKNGGGLSQKNAAGGGIHDDDGLYAVDFNATDTNTAGILVISIQVAGAAPFRTTYYVTGDLPGVAGALATYDGPTDTEVREYRDAILDKLLAYVQLITRGDAGIATDRAAELAEINADEGSGTGGYAVSDRSLQGFGGYVEDLFQEVPNTVWGNDQRTLSSGVNIALSKGVGITGFNDLSFADAQAAALAAVQAYDPPTFGEMENRTLLSSEYISSGDVALSVTQGLQNFDAPTNTDLENRTIPSASYATDTDLTQALNILGDLTEDDGGVLRFTTNALEQSPAGGGAVISVGAAILEARLVGTSPENQVVSIIQGESKTLTIIVESGGGLFDNAVPTTIAIDVTDSQGTKVTIPNADITRVAEDANIQVFRFTLDAADTETFAAGLLKVQANIDSQKVRLGNNLRIYGSL